LAYRRRVLLDATVGYMIPVTPLKVFPFVIYHQSSYDILQRHLHTLSHS
jgi:hypothetical protein